jgi:hypothetical protein
VGVEGEEDVTDPRRESAQQIEREKTGGPQASLEVVSEYPEVEHVPNEMHPPTMKEHRGE